MLGVYFALSAQGPSFCCQHPRAVQVYKLTGETGSYRYMAPEVFRHEPYNLKVDVYSFAMIIFQLFETTTPFHGHDPVDAARQAAMLGARPGFPPRRNLTPMTQVLDTALCYLYGVLQAMIASIRFVSPSVWKQLDPDMWQLS